MKFSTRARYGLRMMVELARLQKTQRLVQLRRIAKITGLSNNYLGQLAISLKDDGLLVGVSGKKGGYQLARPAEEITLRQIIRAVQGPLLATECVGNPDTCLNAEFCEARTIWALITDRIQSVLDEYTLADVIGRDWMTGVRTRYPDLAYLHLDQMAVRDGGEPSEPGEPGCPTSSRK